MKQFLFKVLLITFTNRVPAGTGFGSKSTLVEQLRFICSGYFSEQDRTKWLGIVHNDMRQSLQALVYIFRGQNPKGDKHTFPSNYILPRVRVIQSGFIISQRKVIDVRVESAQDSFRTA